MEKLRSRSSMSAILKSQIMGQGALTLQLRLSSCLYPCSARTPSSPPLTAGGVRNLGRSFMMKIATPLPQSLQLEAARIRA